MITAKMLSGADEDVCMKATLSNHDRCYLFDCGRASGLTIKDTQDLGAMFVTHTHIDHFNAFDDIMRHQLGIGRGIPVFGPRDIQHRVSAKMRAYTWNLSFDDQAVFYDAMELDELHGVVRTWRLRVPDWEPTLVDERAWAPGDVILETKAFTARATILDHLTPCVAYRLDEPEKIKMGKSPHRPGPWIAALKEAFAASDGERTLDVHGEEHRAAELFEYISVQQGDSVGFVMDHAASEENHALIEATFSGVRRLFIESYYREEHADLAALNHHSTARRSGIAARRAGAEEVVPVHYSRRYNAEVEELIAECMEGFGGGTS